MNTSTDRLYAALRRNAERECQRPDTEDSYLIGLLLGVLDGEADPERLEQIAARYESEEDAA